MTHRLGKRTNPFLASSESESPSDECPAWLLAVVLFPCSLDQKLLHTLARSLLHLFDQVGGCLLAC